MAEQKPPRTDVTDPVTGEPMVHQPEYSAGAASDRVVRNTAIVGGAQRVADAIAEKEEEAGRLYVNPRTGYQMRVRDDDDLTQAAESAANTGGARGSSRRSPREE